MLCSIGLVGLPNVGKSTIFNAVTKQSVPSENYPFCTIDPTVGIIAVPDERLERLSEISSSLTTIPAVIQVTDIAGLVQGASKGEGLGNEFLSHIREVDAIAHVVRIFKNPEIVHVSGKENPITDIQTIHTELMLSDIQIVEKIRSGLKKKVSAHIKESMKRDAVLKKAYDFLLTEKLLSEGEFTDEEKNILRESGVLSIKPILFILNFESVGENVHDDVSASEKIERLMGEMGAPYIFLDAFLESVVATETDEGKEEMRHEVGVTENGIDAFVRCAHKLLNLITFFTTGEKETRAWTIPRGSSAPDAGAAIHTDFQKKFIRAEVVSYGDFIACGSYTNAREQGKIRTEGKDYIVEDGDIIEFKI